MVLVVALSMGRGVGIGVEVSCVVERSVVRGRDSDSGGLTFPNS